MVVSLFTVVAPIGVPGAPTAAMAVDPACVDSSLPPPSTTTAAPGATTVITQDGSTVEVPPTAVDAPTAIEADSLCASQLPPLDSGMTNVTEGLRDGYRFTPHMTFDADLHITVPYDDALIPAGLAEQDVQIFYYDTAQLQWVPLQRDSLDQTADQVESLSNHFTDMIAATVTVPDHPENVSLNPTSIKDLKAGDPSSGVGLVQPPSGNSEGDARISYPIDLPDGRQGMAPELGLGYSSAAGNGWLGVGWDLSVPSIGIDTRWGVPRYDAANETETYVVGGGQLTPVANRGPEVPRTAEKVFRSRVEGEFNKIVRHGSTPANYWWEVTDSDGTRSFFGGDPESGPVAAARLADDAGNIFRWALRETRELHGNAVRYDYQTVTDAGVAGGTVLGRQLYLRTIDYTRKGSTAGPYTVKFVRDSELANYTRRSDVVIDARGGFKMVTAELLARIEVAFQDAPVRSYDLAYQNGAFGKKLLASVTQRGANNTSLGTHTFSYYDDIRNTAGGYDAYATPVNWTVGADGVTGGLLGRGQASAISGSLSTSTGGHLYAGYNQTKPTKQGSAGGKVGFSHSSTDGKLALVDLNGDDLPDKVFKTGSGISVRFNTSGPDGSTDFGSPVATPTLPGLAKESAETTSFGAEVYLTVNAFANHAETFTKDTTYFSDVNGDGLTDLVHDGAVLFNHLDANGVPTFTADSSDTSVPIGSGILDSAGLVADYTASKNQQDANNPPVDVLRRWTAPLAGTVQITGAAALVQDTSPERAAYTGADGVRVAIQNNGAELWSAVIGATDYTAKTPTGVSSVTVTKGDRLYFRVGSRSDGAYDQVTWDPVIQYVSSGVAKPAILDANRLNGYRYQASQDFAMAGRSGAKVQAPLNGSVRLTGNLHKLGATSDDITLEVIKNGQVITSQPMAGTAIGDIPVQTDMTVAKGDTIALHVKVDTPIDVSKLAWTPTLHYLSSPDVATVTDDAGNPLIQLHPPFDIDTYPANTSTSVDGQQWTAPATETVSVKPVITAASGANGTATFTVKRRGGLMAKRTITISNGVVSGTGAFPVDVTVNEFVFFNVASADPTLRAKITSRWVEVTRPGMAAVAPSLSWYSAATSGMLAAPYRGWSYVGYNGAGARGTGPIVEADLDQAFSSSSTYDPRTANAHPFYPSAEDGSWRGADGSAWVKASTMSASREGMDSIGVPTAADVAGARAVARLSHTTQDAVGGEVSFLSGSTSTGGTASDVDFLDLNGDRFPDIVSNGKVQYSSPNGGLESASKAVSGLGAPRDSDASAVNGGVGGSPAHFAANGRGEVDTSNSGPVRGNKTGSQMAQLGLQVQAGLGKGTSKPKHDLLDVNGDGLPDVVSRNGAQLMVALNLGYGFAAAEPWGTAVINDGASENGTIGATLGFNAGLYDFAGGLSLTKNKSLTRETLEDVNGDGLADRVLPGGSSGMQVGLNTGNGFAAPIAWSGALNGACKDDTSVGQADLDWEHARLCSGSTGLGAGAYFTVGIPLCGAQCFLILNPGADTDQSMARDEASLRDLDGDGNADHLASSDDGQLKVARNRTGRTNLLKSVSRPLDATFTMEYTRDGNTTANPTSRWTLTKVTLTDGHVGDGVDTQATAYSYSGGVYSRLEREFYGYAQVTQQQLDTAHGNAVYRSTVQDFRVDSFYTRGLLARERLYRSGGAPMTDTEHTYVLRDVSTGAEPADGASTSATIFPMLTRTDKRFHEGLATPNKTTATVNHYDVLGHIDTTTDYGETISADDVIARIGYTSCPTTQVRTANSITVTGGATLMRRRESTVNCATGDVTQVRQYLADGSAAVTDLTYTAEGNILKVTDPANAGGQRGWLSYEYDTPTGTQVTKITDNFGLSSTATHDLRFGSVLTQVDANNNSTTYVYDEFGRPTSFTGPYEQGTITPTIRFEYHPEATTPWAITRHLDKYRSATDTIDTVVFIDGLGRTIQTKKDATIYTGATSAVKDVMVVSGQVTLDSLGRQNHVSYPVTEPLGTPGTFNASVDTVMYTNYDYDSLDRLTQVIYPDGTKTGYRYEFGGDLGGIAQFQQIVTDANGHEKKYYRNVREQLVALKEYHTPTGAPTYERIWTSYVYNPLGELVTVKDNSNNITRQSFDNLGRRTVIDNPDTGKTTMSYDLASNLTAKVTANLAATSQQVSYGYDVDRLVWINYPRFPANNVTYAYGASGASDNRAGRITRVTDQAGSEDRFYGKLGETTKEVRTVVGDTGSSPKTYTTSYVYDTFGRQQSMIYPDGETLTYRYDSGGMVRAASGVKGNDNYSYVTRLEYDKFGQKAFVQDGNGVKTTYAFDPVMRRLSNQQAGPLLSPNGADLGNFQNASYTYNKVGNVKSVANNIAMPAPPNFGGPSTQTFTYDDLDRLTDASGSYQFAPGKSNNYSYALGYDNLHNITVKNQTNTIAQGSGTPVTQGETTYSYAYAYAATQPHAPSHIGTQTYAYDANGNQLGWSDDNNGQQRTIIWDEENRIQSIFDNGQEQRYKYDDAGQRVIKRGPQGETAYVNQYFTMRNGQIGTKHVFIDTTRVASKLVKANAYEKDTYYFHADQLSSTNYVTDSGGKLYEHLEYFPSGEAWIEEKSNSQRTPYRFAGKELDEETGLYYFGARYHDPRTSVWQSPDPALHKNLAQPSNVTAPSFLNPYNYADANPMSKADPDGRQALTTAELHRYSYYQGVGWNHEGVQYNQDIGLGFQRAAMQYWGRTENRALFTPPQTWWEMAMGTVPPSIRPDAVGPLHIVTTDTGTGAPTINKYSNSVFFEVKAVNGTLHLSSNNYQIRSMIDELANSEAATAGYVPLLAFPTTSNTIIGSDIVTYAEKRGVLLAQALAYTVPAGTRENPNSALLGFTPMMALNYPKAMGAVVYNLPIARSPLIPFILNDTPDYFPDPNPPIVED
ncbi:MAG TPA: SpvB/TcaC N-terminal domain-containing protein [Jatrophihabitans sp.]|jgi:RHS repeat-associated protein|uniref:SpvB/TcaC N-terminal domain-containing protein n=1 Tax=Jatrophihabitans sp. TaxID=1932789 RepID=UPI002F09C361